MAFGFSPKYTQDYILNDLTGEDFLVLAAEASSQLNWEISFVNKQGFIAHTKLSWSSVCEEVTVQINGDTAHIKSECAGNQFLDWGKNKKNVQKLIATIEELKTVLTHDEIAVKFAMLQADFAPQDEGILNNSAVASKGRITGILSIFKPVEGYFVTPILININLFVFVAMIISGVHILLPEVQSLLQWGANFRPLTLEGQWWRLFTACFLHIGILHLLLNMYALLYIGILLEPYLGKTRFLAAYIISGIAASVTSLWWHDLTVSAGASGAIFGMYGVFLALLTTNLLDKSAKKSLLTSIGVFVAYNILNGFKADSGVDNAAHIGGLISGLVIGYSFIPSLKQQENTRISITTIGGLIAVLLAASFFTYRTLPNDINAYEEKMRKFVLTESMALEVYNLPEGTPDHVILSELRERGIYYWNENLELINSLKNLNLPAPVIARNAQLKEYCELRLKSYELIYKSIEENTDEYQNEINEYTDRIEEIIHELTGK